MQVRAACVAIAMLGSVLVLGAGSAAAQAATCMGSVVTVDLGAGELPTDGPDVVLGTDGADVVALGAGDDLMCAGAGDDQVWGQDGNDRIFGEDGEDKLRGGDGDDNLHGGAGADDLNGGRDNDGVFGQGGNDIKVRGGTGDDYVHGGDGDDLLVAGNGGSDEVGGGDGDDALLSGGPRPDIVRGGDGDDVLKGHGGADALFGGAGADELRGGKQPDTLDGGSGTDLCNGGTEEDRSSGCETAEIIELAMTPPPREVLEAEWADQRAEVVASIREVGSGIGADSVLRGPGGFTADLSGCPSGWSDTEGVSTTTIELAATMAQSGALAAYGMIGEGMGAYFDDVNASGGIGPDGLMIDWTVIDDRYVATTTQGVTDGLIAFDRPLAISTLGTPNAFAVRDRINDSCVPHPFVLSGHQAWGDPVNYPWTTGSQMSYSAEAHLWARWIEQNLADRAPVTVTALVMDNDFGLAYAEAFAAAAEASPVIGAVVAQYHDPAAPDVVAELANLSETLSDVFIAMTAGNPCLLTVVEADRSGFAAANQAVWLPSVCTSVPNYMAPAGSAADGWMAMRGGLHSLDNDAASNPWLSEVAGLLQRDGIDPAVELAASGAGFYGWTYVEALRVAAALPGGVTRTNLMLAARSVDFDHPYVLDGIAFEMDGAADPFPIEGSNWARYSVDAGAWQDGGVLDLNGTTTACDWVPGAGCS